MIKLMLKSECSMMVFGWVVANYYPFMTVGLMRIQEMASR